MTAKITTRPLLPRGFAAMTPEMRSEISRRGGQRAHEVGRAHCFTTEEAKAAGRKGGRASGDRYGYGVRSAAAIELELVPCEANLDDPDLDAVVRRAEGGRPRGDSRRDQSSQTGGVMGIADIREIVQVEADILAAVWERAVEDHRTMPVPVNPFPEAVALVNSLSNFLRASTRHPPHEMRVLRGGLVIFLAALDEEITRREAAA